MQAEMLGFLALGYQLLIAFAIAMARSFAMIMLTPAFTRLGLTGLVKNAVAFALALPLAPEIFHQLGGLEAPGGLQLVMILAKELVVGALIGLAFGIPFWGAEYAGEMIDLQRGSTMSQILDPSSSSESSLTATLFSLMMVVLFFMSGGFLTLAQAMYESYRIWPTGAALPQLDAQAALAVLSVLDGIGKVAIAMIGPLIIAILLADVMLALLSRMAPQLHIFDLSLSIKNLVFSALICIYMIFLAPIMFGLVTGLDSYMPLLRSFAGP